MHDLTSIQSLTGTKIKEHHYWRPENLTDGFTKGKQERDAALYELARTCVLMVRAQMFQQGNHRTAVLSLIEYLYSVGIEYKKDPIKLYLKLIPATYPMTEMPEFTEYIYKKLNKSIHKGKREMTPEIRMRYIKRCKYAEMLWHERRDGENKLKKAHTALAEATDQVDKAYEKFQEVKVPGDEGAKKAAREQLYHAEIAANVAKKELKAAEKNLKDVEIEWGPKNDNDW